MSGPAPKLLRLSQSPLESLPHDLVWAIIDFVPEAICELRMTSRALKHAVDEFALRPSFILADHLRISGLSKPAGILVSINVPARKSNAFELSMKSRISRVLIKSIKKFSTLFCPSGEYVKYVLQINNLPEEIYAMDSLGKALNWRIAKVELKILGLAHELPIIAKILGEKWIGTLEISAKIIGVDEADNLIKLIDANSIDELILHVGQVNIAHPVEFLYNLASRLKALCIVQKSIGDIDHYSMFGMWGAVAWPEIIFEMFSKKLDRLMFVNHHYPDYLSPAKADILKERLPLLGKNIWFSATCDAYAIGFEYTSNYHTVIAVGNGPNIALRNLSVKHLSRENEKFAMSM